MQTIAAQLYDWLAQRPSPVADGLLIFSITLLVYGQYGWEGALTRDIANAMYSGQQMGQGVPHYRSIFNHSGVLGPLLSGVGAMIASSFDTNDLLTVRILFALLASLALPGIYLLVVSLFDSRRAGLLAALAFLCYTCFGKHAMTGPSGKVVMVTCQVFALWLTIRKRWFYAGLCGGLAFLGWQPAALYGLLAVILAFIQSERRERRNQVIRALIGTAIPLLAVSLYFLSQGVFYEFVDGTILFNLFDLEREPSTWLRHLGTPILTVFRSYTLMAMPILLGFIAMCALYRWRLKLAAGRVYRLLSQDRFAVVLLSFPVPIIWSLLDFQGCPDFYIFLPYVTLGFAWLLLSAFDRLTVLYALRAPSQKLAFALLCMALLAVSAITYRIISESGLRQQRQWADEFRTQFGQNPKLVSLGAPEVLVMLHQTNPNPYVFIISGIDNRIQAKTPGGFSGWLAQLEAYDPEVLAIGKTTGRFKAQLDEWLATRYREMTIGDWKLRVKREAQNGSQ